MILPRSLAGPLFLLALGLVVAPGCGGGEKFASVSGTVKFKGKLMNGGQVVLANEDNTKVERATIQSDGTYTTSRVPYGALKVGVEPAPKMLIMPKNAKPPKDASGEGAEAYARKSAGDYVDIPDQKRSPLTSNLVLTIDSSSKKFDIDIQ